jgi:hypothetical protein
MNPKTRDFFPLSKHKNFTYTFPEKIYKLSEIFVGVSKVPAIEVDSNLESNLLVTVSYTIKL